MRNGWKEAQERVLFLPEDPVDAFDIFASFIYAGKIYSAAIGSDKYDSEDEWL